MTTLPAMVLAAGGLPDWLTVVATMLGGTLAAGSANALNCYLDRDIDAVMRRTGRRPLARHEVSPLGALIFGLILGVIAVCTIGFTTNWLAGALTFVAIAFYVVIYTMLLKRRTAQNIVWGEAAGCMPVLIGWSAVTGSLALAPFALFAVVFFWTPPHTWALATRYREDYARAGVPMLPVVATPEKVAREIVIYTWLTHLLPPHSRSGRSQPVGSTACSLLPLASCCSSARTDSRRRRAAGRGARWCSSTSPTATWRSCSSPWPSTPSCAGCALLYLSDVRRTPRRGRGRATLLTDALAAVGIDGRWQSWDDPSTSWSDAPTLIRSTWNYTTDLPGFLSWAASVRQLHNGVEAVSWSSDKTYLGELAAAGLPIVPTSVFMPGRGRHAFPDSVEFVVKPSIGGRLARLPGRFEQSTRRAGRPPSMPRVCSPKGAPCSCSPTSPTSTTRGRPRCCTSGALSVTPTRRARDMLSERTVHPSPLGTEGREARTMRPSPRSSSKNASRRVRRLPPNSRLVLTRSSSSDSDSVAICSTHASMYFPALTLP